MPQLGRNMKTLDPQQTIGGQGDYRQLILNILVFKRLNWECKLWVMSLNLRMLAHKRYLISNISLKLEIKSVKPLLNADNQCFNFENSQNNPQQNIFLLESM